MSTKLNTSPAPGSKEFEDAVRENLRLSPSAAAKFLGLSLRTLTRYRSNNAGPPYDKSGTAGSLRPRILYPIAALAAWQDTSTQFQNAHINKPNKNCDESLGK
jgi:hypothetical protein